MSPMTVARRFLRAGDCATSSASSTVLSSRLAQRAALTDQKNAKSWPASLRPATGSRLPVPSGRGHAGRLLRGHLRDLSPTSWMTPPRCGQSPAASVPPIVPRLRSAWTRRRERFADSVPSCPACATSPSPPPSIVDPLPDPRGGDRAPPTSVLRAELDRDSTRRDQGGLPLRRPHDAVEESTRAIRSRGELAKQSPPMTRPPEGHTRETFSPRGIVGGLHARPRLLLRRGEPGSCPRSALTSPPLAEAVLHHARPPACGETAGTQSLRRPPPCSRGPRGAGCSVSPRALPASSKCPVVPPVMAMPAQHWRRPVSTRRHAAPRGSTSPYVREQPTLHGSTAPRLEAATPLPEESPPGRAKSGRETRSASRK